MSAEYRQGLVDALGELAWSLDAQGRKADSLTCTRAAIEIAGTLHAMSKVPEQSPPQPHLPAEGK